MNLRIQIQNCRLSLGFHGRTGFQQSTSPHHQRSSKQQEQILQFCECIYSFCITISPQGTTSFCARRKSTEGLARDMSAASNSPKALDKDFEHVCSEPPVLCFAHWIARSNPNRNQQRGDFFFSGERQCSWTSSVQYRIWTKSLPTFTMQQTKT